MSDPERTGWGHGLATRAKHGTVLDVWFPSPALGNAPEIDPPSELEAEERIDETRRVRIEAVTVEADLDAPVASTADASASTSCRTCSSRRTRSRSTR
jgi:2,3,4,5-tetrahydropyridine-2-carboxylate N-succinyltransferase